MFEDIFLSFKDLCYSCYKKKKKLQHFSIYKFLDRLYFLFENQ